MSKTIPASWLVGLLKNAKYLPDSSVSSPTISPLSKTPPWTSHPTTIRKPHRPYSVSEPWNFFPFRYVSCGSSTSTSEINLLQSQPLWCNKTLPISKKASSDLSNLLGVRWMAVSRFFCVPRHTLFTHLASLTPDRERIQFAARSDHLLGPDTPLRDPELDPYPL